MIDPPGRLFGVRGTRLHVIEHGHPSAPAVLFVHGGPGQGSYDFVHHQARHLGTDVRLVAVDQRGSLFSDPLADTDDLTETSSVDDLDAVRELLGIESWAVLGHSFGGRIALRYALAHPDRVRGLALENPLLDWTRGATALLAAAVPVLEETGASEADEARDLVEHGVPATTQAVETQGRLMAALGPRRPEVYVHQQHWLADLSGLLPSTALPADVRDRGNAAAARLRADPQLLEPLLHRVADLRVPLLLVAGLYDPVLDDDTIEIVNATAEEGEVVWLDESGHFCHGEEPAAYAGVVVDWVRSYS